ncbi:MAG: hypothetical protein SGARI_000132, partial [Bacillariaceae sp.]
MSSEKVAAGVVSPGEVFPAVVVSKEGSGGATQSPSTVVSLPGYLQKCDNTSDDEEEWEMDGEPSDEDSDDDMLVDDEAYPGPSPAPGERLWHSARCLQEPSAWRLDPKETHSDFVIVVQGEGKGEKAKEYHVHKVFLSVGAVKSGFFCSFFAQESSSAENEGNRAVIKVPDMAARAFPAFLDFVYSQGGRASLFDNAETTVGAMFLADYLDVPGLGQLIEDILERELTCQNCHEYYQCATTLQQEKVVRLVEGFVQENVNRLKTTSPLWKVLSMESMVEIIGSERHLTEDFDTFKSGTGREWKVPFLNVPASLSRHLSKLVLAFLQSRETSDEIFRVLTQEEFLPCIDKKAAIKLMDMENKICVLSGEETSLSQR